MDNTKTIQKQIAKVSKSNKDQAAILNGHLKAYQGALSTAKKLDAQAKLLESECQHVWEHDLGGKK